MKNLIIAIFLFAFNLSAKDTVSSSELLKMSSVDKNAYMTLRNLGTRVSDLDYKDIQYNSEAGNYLLKLLDVKEYVDYKIKYYDRYYSKGNLKSFLLQKYSKAGVDSIYKTPSILKFYSDSLRRIEKEKYINDFYFDNNSCSYYIENYIFKELKYPEAYQMILDDLAVNDNSALFRNLLKLMQDTVEWKRYVQDLKQKTRQNEISKEDFYKISRNFNRPCIYGVCAIDFYISMLDLNLTSLFRSDDYYVKYIEIPYNIMLLCEYSEISNFLFQSDDSIIKSIYKSLYGEEKELPLCCCHGYDNFTPYDYPLCKMTYAELEEISDYIIKNKEHFIKALEPLKEKYDKENEWWRSKITYRK